MVSISIDFVGNAAAPKLGMVESGMHQQCQSGIRAAMFAVHTQVTSPARTAKQLADQMPCVQASMTDVPETMRALESAESGAPISALRVVDNRPTPRAGTASSAPASLKPVLVKVEWAAVQNVDNYLLAGYLSSKVEWPFVTGVEFAGTIAEVCDGSRWKVGDRVWGCTSLGYAGSGTLAEYCSTAEDLVGALPAGVPMEQAATLCCTGMTAAAGIWDLLQLDKEYKSENAKTCVVVYGAGTSVGQYGVQLAKVAGALSVTSGTACRQCSNCGTCVHVFERLRCKCAATLNSKQHDVDVGLRQMHEN